MIIYVIEGNIGDYYNTHELLGASDNLQDIYNNMLSTLSEQYYGYIVTLFEKGATIGYVEVDQTRVYNYQDFEKTVLSGLRGYE